MGVNSIDKVYRLFLQVWRECEFDKGYAQGYGEIKKEFPLKMLKESIDDETIQYTPDFQSNSFKNSKVKIQFPVLYIESSLSTVSASIGLLSLRIFLTTGNLNE